MTICSREGCGQPIPRHINTYSIHGRPEEYCSKSCCDEVYQQLNRKGRKKMEKHAAGFGDARVVRQFCDVCKEPVTLAWKSKDLPGRVACSNDHLKILEEKGEIMGETTDTEVMSETTEAETPATSHVNGAPPIVAAKTSTKKKAPAKKAKAKVKADAPAKKAVKTAPAKKAAKAAKPAKEPKVAKAKASKEPGTGVVDPFGIFRQGTAKAALGKCLSDGKWHSTKELVAICEEYKVSRGPIGHVLTDIAAAKHKLESQAGENGKEFRVPKK